MGNIKKLKTDNVIVDCCVSSFTVFLLTYSFIKPNKFKVNSFAKYVYDKEGNY